MDNPPPSPALPALTRPAPPWMGMLALGLLLAALVAFFQFASGSRQAELGSHPDEAAHFVTGLMVRDYFASGFHESPLRYADDYYRHYPKIGLGVWPPFFYILQAACTLVLPAAVPTVLSLMAVLGLTLGLVTARALWREFGWPEAVTGAVLLTALPLVQQYSNMVMAEILVAVLMLCAILSFARFLDSGGLRGAAGFGIFAGLAIMTKGTGLALVFVPLLAIAFTGRFDLLKKPRLWLAAGIVLVIAGPWTWHFRNDGRGGWAEPSPSMHFTAVAIGFYARQLLVASGWLLACLAIAGALALFLAPRRSGLLASSLALVIGIWIFHCLTPVGFEARHLTPSMPPLIILALAGLRWITRGHPKVGPAACAALLALFFGLPLLAPPISRPVGYGSLGSEIALSPFRIPKKEWRGFMPAAQAALAGNHRHLFVASDSRGEGSFIADVAMLDPHRPSLIVDRASKLLASSTWSGAGYQSFYTTPAQVFAALERAGVQAVVLDSSLPTLNAGEKLLRDALAPQDGPYRQAGTWDSVRDGISHKDGIALFSAVPRPQ